MGSCEVPWSPTSLKVQGISKTEVPQHPFCVLQIYSLHRDLVRRKLPQCSGRHDPIANSADPSKSCPYNKAYSPLPVTLWLSESWIASDVLCSIRFANIFSSSVTLVIILMWTHTKITKLVLTYLAFPARLEPRNFSFHSKQTFMFASIFVHTSRTATSHRLHKSWNAVSSK